MVTIVVEWHSKGEKNARFTEQKEIGCKGFLRKFSILLNLIAI